MHVWYICTFLSLANKPSVGNVLYFPTVHILPVTRLYALGIPLRGLWVLLLWQAKYVGV